MQDWEANKDIDKNAVREALNAPPPAVDTTHDNEWTENKNVKKKVVRQVLGTDANYVRRGNEPAPEAGSFEADIAAIQANTPDAVSDWKRIAEATIRISAQGGEEAEQTKNALLWQYGEQLRPHIEAAGGTDWWDANYTEAPEIEDDSRFGWKGKLAAASPLFEYLDQWGQSTLGTVGGIRAAFDPRDDIGLVEGLTHAGQQAQKLTDVSRAIPIYDGVTGGYGKAGDVDTAAGGATLDNDGDGSLNTREALGFDAEAGGRTAGFFDLLGTILLDPTTYVTFGGSTAARAGLKSAEEAAATLAEQGVEGISRGYARELNQRILREGFKSLEDGEQILYKSLLKVAAEEAAAAGGRTTTRLGRDLVEAQLSALGRGGQSGIKLGGRTIVPTGGLRAPKQGFGRVIQGGDDAAAALGRRLNDLIDAGDLTEGTLSAIGRTELDEIIPLAVRQGFIASTDIGQSLIKLLSNLKPRVATALRHGDSVADDFGHLLSVNRAADSALNDIQIRLGTDIHKGNVLRNAIEEFGNDVGLSSQLDRVLSDPAQEVAVRASFGPEANRLLDTLINVREEIFEATLRGQGFDKETVAGFLDGSIPLPANMHQLDTYVPRVLTGAVRNDARLMREIKNTTGRAGLNLDGTADEGIGEAFLKARTASEANSVFKANEEMSAILADVGVDSVDALFDTNVPAAFVSRARSAFQAAADIDLLDGITNLQGAKGLPLGFRVTPDDVAASKLGEAAVASGMIPKGGRLADYRALDTESGVKYFIHNDVADELENLRKFFGEPRDQATFTRLYAQANNAWAASATVGFVNPGFHARNSVGNVFNMALGGVRNPEVIVRSAKLQATNRRIRQAMADTGADYVTAARGLDLDDVTIKTLTEARRTGVLGDSRTLDLTRETGGQANRTPSSESLGSKLDPRKADAIYNRPGMALGETVEGNARLALFLDQLDKGATPNVAAQHVKKYLFDYGDLTRFENETLRAAARFYTFTRKNTAVQFHTLTRYPGRVANAQAVVDQLTEFPLDGGVSSAVEGQSPEWLRNPVTGVLNGQDVALKIDSPFESFQDISELATVWFQQDDPLAPGGSRLQRFSEKFDSLFSGVGVSALDYLQELATGEDSFTGRPLYPSDGADHLRDNAGFRLVETFLPAAARLERYAASAGVTRDGEGERDPGLALLNFVTGFQVAELGEDAANSQRTIFLSELARISDDLRQEFGTYDAETNPDGFRTLDQLREAGELGQKDQIATALLYSWTKLPNGELEWDPAVLDARLLNAVPKDVLRAFGLPESALEAHSGSGPGARVEQEDGYYDELDLANAIKAYETWRGVPLSEEEKLDFIIASPWAPSNTLLEGLGIEPYRPGNRFDEGEEAPSYSAQLEEAEEVLNRLAESQGLEVSAFAAFRPRLAEFQRILDDAEEAGISQDQLHDYILLGKDEGGGGVLSRNDKAFINQLLGFDRADGPVPLTTTRFPEITEDDERKIRERAWEAQQEYLLFSQVYGLPVPTAEQIEIYVLNSIANAGTLDHIGTTDLKGAPNREDTRTEDQKLGDSYKVYRAGKLGLEGPTG